MTISELIERLNLEVVTFETVMSVIDTHYAFTPTAFSNGNQHNEANTNNGSCKIFAFAKLNDLSQQATLNAFGEFYTEDVLKHPQGTNHANIRNFMVQGWSGIEFEQPALTLMQTDKL